MAGNDVIGQKFGYLLVSDKVRTNNQTRYVCKCQCGQISLVAKQKLVHGRTKSCGCKRAELFRSKIITHGASTGELLPTYNSYVSMMDRCYNASRKHYANYGGIGITVLEPGWNQPMPDGFTNFLVDMGVRPNGKTLDRINPLIGYSKDNCRWSNATIQAYNTGKPKVNRSSQYRGVSKVRDKWTARICRGHKMHNLGYYETEELAALTYNKAAVELYGNDAKLNKIGGQHGN